MSLKWPSDQRFPSKRAAATFSRMVLPGPTVQFTLRWRAEAGFVTSRTAQQARKQGTQIFLSTTICRQTVDRLVSYKQVSLSKRFRSSSSFSSVQTSAAALYVLGQFSHVGTSCRWWIITFETVWDFCLKPELSWSWVSQFLFLKPWSFSALLVSGVGTPESEALKDCLRF